MQQCKITMYTILYHSVMIYFREVQQCAVHFMFFLLLVEYWSVSLRVKHFIFIRRLFLLCAAAISYYSPPASSSSHLLTILSEHFHPHLHHHTHDHFIDHIHRIIRVKVSIINHLIHHHQAASASAS